MNKIQEFKDLLEDLVSFSKILGDESNLHMNNYEEICKNKKEVEEELVQMYLDAINEGS